MQSVPSVLSPFLFHGTALILAGLAASRLLRRRAAQAHQVLLLALAASALVPCLSLTVRSLNWGLVAGPTAPTFGTGPMEMPVDLDTTWEPAEPLPRSSSQTSVQIRSNPTIRIPWAQVICWAWAGTSLALLIHLTWAFGRARRMVRQAHPLCLVNLEQAIQAARAHLGVDRGILVLAHEAVHTPLLWAWGRDIRLLVPAEASKRPPGVDWFAVVCHELSHAMRRDHLSGLLAECLCRLLPWQPLAWIAKRRLVGFSEQACDDWVLACGHEGCDYAESLVALAYHRAPAFVPAVVSSETGLAGRIHRILRHGCIDPRLGRTWTWAACATALTLVVGLAFGQTRRPAPPAAMAVQPPEPNGAAPGQSQTGEPLAWHILRNGNSGPLLLGMPQRLGTMAGSTRRTEPVWTGRKEGTRLTLSLEVEGTDSREILVGFFRDAAWSADPVQIRSFPGPGEYTLEDLPAGSYQIGAMTGLLARPDAIGVHENWPRPVLAEPGKPALARILLSRRFRDRGMPYPVEEKQQYAQDNLLQGRVTGPDGGPVAFATIQIRQWRPNSPGGSRIAAPDRSTDAQGYYRYDGMNWPYTVGAIRYEPLPSLYGYRHQYQSIHQVFEGPQSVDFHFDAVQGGTAGVTGSVKDQHGRPLQGYFLRVSTWPPAWQQDQNEPDGARKTETGYDIPFLGSDGRYEITGLPAGRYGAYVIPFQTIEYEFDAPHPIELTEGKTATLNLQVIAKGVLHGRVLFEDGSPAVVPGAKTKILMPSGGLARGLAELDEQGFFQIRLSDPEIEGLRSTQARLIVQVPGQPAAQYAFDLLDADKAKVTPLKISPSSVRVQDANLSPRLPSETDQAYTIQRAATKQGPVGPVLQRGASLPNGTPLPMLDRIQTRFDRTSFQGRRILLCFWDMDQRPSRNLLDQLTGQADALRRNHIEVLAVQVPATDQAKLDAWLSGHKVPFHTGQATDSEDKLLERWRVPAMPWMILTDPNHMVQAQGFNIRELRDGLASGDFTALPSQAPLGAVRAVRTAPQVQNPNWQEAFYRLYRLKQGEVLKRIAPPFIPEREDYYVERDAETPDRAVFHWDGEDGRPKGSARGFGDSGSVGSTLSFVLQLKTFEYEGPQDLLAIALPGDWSTLMDAPIEDRLKALERIVAKDLGRVIRFSKERVERLAVVATGRFDPHPLLEETGSTDIQLFSDDMPSEGGGGGTSDSIRDFLRSVGNLAGMPFLDETEPSELSKVSYRSHRSSYLRSLPSEERQAKLKLLLDNLSKQTNLRFEVTRRPVEVWFVTEGP